MWNALLGILLIILCVLTGKLMILLRAEERVKKF